jgi:outer membrane protein OmpA-like peptidoglycan-associated protein
LHFDPQSHSARFETPITFEGNSASLSAEGKRQLDDVARFLKSEPARELRVMVAGYAEGRPSTTAPVVDGESRSASARQLGAARAQSVADYLDRHGIAQERLGVSGVGSRGSSDDLAKNGGGVQIYLLPPEATVVGWGPTGETLRR